MPAPATHCGIIAGSAAELYICEDEDPTTADPMEWQLIGDLDNYSLATSSTETNLNSKGWIRTVPTERGLVLTVSGRLNTIDEGQKLVDEAAFALTCEALRFFRFRVPGATGNDPDWVDWGFWAWINRSDIGAATTDPFSWGVVLTFWDEPVELDEDGQYEPPGTGTPGNGTRSTKSGSKATATAGSSGGTTAGAAVDRAA